MELGALANALLNSSRFPCALTGKIIQDGDYVVWFPFFVHDKEDPFWRYNEWPMLREAFDEWEHKDAFLARWYDSLLTSVASRVNVLVNQAGYLVWLADIPPTISVSFRFHGFGLSIPRNRWKDFRDFILRASNRPREFRLPNDWRISVRPGGEKIRVAWEPPPTFKEGRRDRILLDQSEWEDFKDVLREVDRLLMQVSK